MSTTATPNLRAQLAAMIHDGVEPDEAAAAALADMPRDELEAYVSPAVRHEARMIARSVTREREQRVDVMLRDGYDPVAARRTLIGETFSLPSGERVAWLDATAAQHRERADWQRQLAGRCVADAERHDRAAADIEAAGVTSLADLDTAP